MQFRKRCVTKDCKVIGVFVPNAVKLTEKDRKFTFQAIVRKANRLARLDD